MCGSVWATDSVSTRYSRGEFVSRSVVDVTCTQPIGEAIIDSLIGQLTTDFEQLFTWAFKGLGKQGDEEHDEVVLEIKESQFDPASGLCHMLADFHVSKVTSFRDIPLDSRVTKSKTGGDSFKVDVDIFYSNAILKKAYGTFFAYKISDHQIRMGVQIHVRFGWFFNIFITQRRFRNIIEWRMQGFMNNLRTEAERRYAQQILTNFNR